MLAQSLVKRDLFPGSDLLKSKERVPVLMEEVLHYDADIVCLQVSARAFSSFRIESSNCVNVR